MVIKVNGTDITESVEVYDYVHDSFVEEKADTLTVKFVDTDDLWDKWDAEPGDSIQLINDSEDTGEMFIKELKPVPGYYIVKASSISDMVEVKRANSWYGLTLLQLAKDIAARYGLSFKSISANDKKFAYLRQDNIDDMRFLEDLCVLNGNAFIVFDKTLTVYSVSTLEGRAAAATATITGENEYSLTTQKAYGSCKVDNGRYSYTLKQSDGPAAYYAIKYPMESDGDAMSYAANLLSFINRNAKSGYFYTSPMATDFAAGSVITLNAERAPSFNGKVLITHVRHSYGEGKSKIWFRGV